MANKRKKTGKERRKKRQEQKSKRNSQTAKMNSAEYSMLNNGIQAQLKGDLTKAEDIYRSILSNNPDNAMALLQLGTVFYTRNELNTAEQYLQEAHAKGANDESYYINYGLICEKLKRNREAEECYKTAIKLNPTASEVYYNMGLLFYKKV